MDNGFLSKGFLSLFLGIFICLIGVFARFIYDSNALSLYSWAILVIGVIVCFAGIYNIIVGSEDN